ncbi:hypothetical protein JMJ35_008921 [Cladonia borealis]|uniref:Uncharacterized protein n=1 Tax=Cladonia borealis TaxID=184061 RepID=A0AA39QT31_9LECA|nr:hypothetical protein JMJ35_008921 [Cladonia borealis]
MLRILPSLTSSHPHPSSHTHPPKTPPPPSTPFLEKGVPPRSTSKRSKPGLYYAHEIRAWKRYTRFLHVVVVVLLMTLAVVVWYGSRAGRCEGGASGQEGGLSFMNLRGWMGRTAAVEKGEKVLDGTAIAGTMKGVDGDNIVLAAQHCGIILEEREEGCLRRFNAVAPSSSMSMGRGEREAWREIKDGLEGLWRGLIESEWTYEGSLQNRRAERTGINVNWVKHNARTLLMIPDAVALIEIGKLTDNV